MWAGLFNLKDNNMGNKIKSRFIKGRLKARLEQTTIVKEEVVEEIKQEVIVEQEVVAEKLEPKQETTVAEDGKTKKRRRRKNKNEDGKQIEQAKDGVSKTVEE